MSASQEAPGSNIFLAQTCDHDEGYKPSNGFKVLAVVLLTVQQTQIKSNPWWNSICFLHTKFNIKYEIQF